jgi:hypothetical protein
MITIKFEYGIDTEVQRVKNTIDDARWLDNNKYKYFLPAFIEKTEQDEETLKKAVEKEYSETEFKEAENAIITGWDKRGKDVEIIQKNIIGANNFDELNLVLTKYGTSGSYRLPNKIIINLRDKVFDFLVKTVIHESIHLMIEKLIKDNNVDHWRKERIVNLIIEKEFQSAYKMNNSPEYAKDVDVLFKEFYPDMILITEKSGKLKTPNIIS